MTGQYKYELYLGTPIPAIDILEFEIISNFLLREAEKLDLSITILYGEGSYKNFGKEFIYEDSIIVIYLGYYHEKELMLNLGEAYKKEFNQECFILNEYKCDFNMY